MKTLIVFVSVVWVSISLASTPTITDVTAHQRNPWNGIVDISYTVTGDIAAAANENGLTITALKVSATDRTTGSNYVANASTLSGDMSLGEGTHYLVWNLGAEGLTFKSSNVVFGVSCEVVPSLYCVIDLSGGTNATSYPITHLTEAPNGGFNTDEYKTTKLALRRIDPGSFMMCGAYSVTLTKPYYMGIFEVTQKQYELVMGSNPSSYTGDKRPVDSVSYNVIRGASNGSNWPSSPAVDPSSFMGKFRSRVGLDFDLPTEAQWEYACRAGTTSDYNNGGSSEDDLKNVGRYFGNTSDGKGGYSEHTTVGSYLANTWGLYDMHGNVWEWCLDWNGNLSSGTDPVGVSIGTGRIRRGGSWVSFWDGCTSSFRTNANSDPAREETKIGFRLARTLVDMEDEICKAETLLIELDLYSNMGFLEAILRTEDNSSTNIVAVCTNDCRVTFKWKCSCEPIFKGNLYDYMSFSIDGVQQAAICGETDWTNQSYTVSGAGEHTFTWTYQKDEQDAAGEDCGWVRGVVVAPLVALSFNGGEAESGMAPADMSFYADDDTAVLPGCGTLALANHSFAGWSDGETVYAAGSACPYLKAAQTLTAVWAANTLSTPIITAPATYEADSATVTITAEEGASIYYTLDGSKPTEESTLYSGPFEVEGSATVSAIAVRDNYFDSEVSQFEVTRLTWTFGEYLNCPGRTFTTGGDAEWVRAKDVSADGFALQSGAITHSQTSRLETVVYGAGTVTFRCKVDGEIIKKIVYDGLAFSVDGVQQGDLMGDADWTEKMFTVAGDGRHVLGWCYVKDEDGNGGGEDCAWLDCVTWTADDPLPALDVAATDGDANAIIAGLSDGRLSEKVFGTAAYGTFRTWVDGNGLSHAAVRDAPNAWFSYALDAPGLMAKASPLASEDIVIESIEPSGVTSGAFDLVVDIAGAEIGTAARLAEVLGVEGSTELNESAFSSEGFTFTLQRTGDGKVKATVTPTGSPTSFFLRVKVK